MHHQIPRHRWPMLLLLAVASAAVASCVDPLGIDTERRVTEVNLDSLVTDPEFVSAPGDSIFARVNGEEIVFRTEVLRPTFHNGVYRNTNYVTVQATRSGLNGTSYDIIAIRLDAIADTGTYLINAPYSAPKYLDSLADPSYAAQYERKRPGGFPESYRTGIAGSSGDIRVSLIDTTRAVMVGRFEFRGYSPERDSTIVIERGAFRLQLRRR